MATILIYRQGTLSQQVNTKSNDLLLKQFSLQFVSQIPLRPALLLVASAVKLPGKLLGTLPGLTQGLKYCQMPEIGEISEQRVALLDHNCSTNSERRLGIRIA